MIARCRRLGHSRSQTTGMTEQTTYLLDVNVLLALSHAAHVHHDRAHGWWSQRAETCRWATAPVTESGLLRLLGSPGVMGDSLPISAGLSVLDQACQDSSHVFLVDGTSLLRPFVSTSHLQGYRQVTDVHLVNLAARHGAVLATLDARLSAMLAPEDRRHVELVRDAP